MERVFFLKTEVFQLRAHKPRLDHYLVLSKDLFAPKILNALKKLLPQRAGPSFYPNSIKKTFLKKINCELHSQFRPLSVRRSNPGNSLLLVQRAGGIIKNSDTRPTSDNAAYWPKLFIFIPRPTKLWAGAMASPRLTAPPSRRIFVSGAYLGNPWGISFILYTHIPYGV